MILPTGTALSPTELWALLDKTGPVAWGVPASVGISKSQMTMKVSSAQVQHVKSSADTVVASLLGTPNLPRAGHGRWRMRNVSGGGAPVASSARSGAPRPKLCGYSQKWKFADPNDILNLAAQTQEYGFLQSTGTQKLFFAQPQLHDAAPLSLPRFRRTSRTWARC